MLTYSSEIEIEPKFQNVEETHFTILLYRCLHFVQVSPKYIRDFTLFIHRTSQRLHNFISLMLRSLYLPRREKESDNLLLSTQLQSIPFLPLMFPQEHKYLKTTKTNTMVCSNNHSTTKNSLCMYAYVCVTFYS